MILCAVASGAAEDISPRAPLPVKLSLRRCEELALSDSLRARIYRNSRDSAGLGYRAAYLSLRFPQVAVSASALRAYSETSPALLQPSPDVILSTSGAAASSYGLSSTYGTQTQAAASVSLPVFATGGALAASASQSRALTNTAGSPPATVETSPSWQASYIQPLFIFTGDPNRRSWRRAQLSYDAAIASLEHERLAIVIDARGLYYQTLLQQSTLDVEVQTLKAAEEIVGITRALTDAGKYAPVELNRAQLRFTQEERRIRNARTALDRAVNNIRMFLQLPGGIGLELTSKLEYRKFAWTSADLVNYALTHRQDYLNAKRSEELLELSLKDLRESARPNLALVGAYGYSRVVPSGSFDARTYNWSAQAQASWLLFDSGTTRAKVDQGLKDLENARHETERVRQQVQVDVENAYLNISNFDEQLRGFEADREMAMNNMKAVRYRYSNGIDRLIDVFDAENQMRALELEYLGLLVDFHSAKGQLALSVNGPLDFDTER